MAERRPLCLVSGLLKQLPSGDTLPVQSNSYPLRWTCWHDEATIIAGNPFTTSLSGSQLYGYIYQSAPANGDSFSHSLCLMAGSYVFSVLGVTASSYGKIDWKLDGTTIVSGQDWFSGGLVYNAVQTATVTVSGDGYHQLVGVVNGKHASSTNYYVPLTKYWFKLATDPARS